MRDINKNEFMIASRGLSDAKDLLGRNYPKDALAALKRPKKILEYGAQKTRMLALVYKQEGDIYRALSRSDKADAAYRKAISVLDAIKDETDLKQECLDLIENPALRS